MPLAWGSLWSARDLSPLSSRADRADRHVVDVVEARLGETGTSGLRIEMRGGPPRLVRNRAERPHLSRVVGLATTSSRLHSRLPVGDRPSRRLGASSQPPAGQIPLRRLHRSVAAGPGFGCTGLHKRRPYPVQPPYLPPAATFEPSAAAS
jgi:hypothetical protein